MATTPAPSSLLLNVAPISFTDATLRAYKVTVDSPDEFRPLRDQYAGRCFVRRVSENEAFIVPLVDGVDIPITLGKLPLKENLGVVSGLVGNALIEYLSSIGRTITRDKPITFLDSRNDLLDGIIPATQRHLAPLAVRPAFVFEPRVFQFASAEPFVGLTISLRVIKSIEPNAAELIKRGWDISGLYVGRKVSQSDSRVAPRLLVVGRVSRIENDELILEDHRDDEDRIPIGEAFIEASVESVSRVLSSAFQKDATEIRSKLFHAENDLHSGANKLARIQQIAQHFEKLSLNLVPGVPFSIHQLLTKLPPVESCSKPVYVFDPMGRQTKTWHDGGLTEYGPYSRTTFTPSRPRICIICNKQWRGRIDAFTQKFLHGIPSTDGKRAPFPNGLLGKYRLENCTTSFFEVENQSADAYKKASLEAIQKSTDEGFRWDLALVQMEESFKAHFGDASPYYVTKSIFLTHQIPVQDFRAETTVLSPKETLHKFCIRSLID